MLKIVIGNKRYSSWSLRGWLAVRHAGLPYEEQLITLWSDAFDEARRDGRLPSGKVPTLWDGEIAVWDSLAIIEHLAERIGRDQYWPSDASARAFARSISAEMHSGFAPLRQQLGMNLGRRYPAFAVNAEAQADIDRIVCLWAEARERFGKGGDYLFGPFGAADMMFAPVVTRFVTYDVSLPRSAQAYVETMIAHPLMREWKTAAANEPVLDRYEY